MSQPKKTLSCLIWVVLREISILFCDLLEDQSPPNTSEGCLLWHRCYHHFYAGNNSNLWRWEMCAMSVCNRYASWSHSQYWLPCTCHSMFRNVQFPIQLLRCSPLWHMADMLMLVNEQKCNPDMTVALWVGRNWARVVIQPVFNGNVFPLQKNRFTACDCFCIQLCFWLTWLCLWPGILLHSFGFSEKADLVTAEQALATSRLNNCNMVLNSFCPKMELLWGCCQRPLILSLLSLHYLISLSFGLCLRPI